VLVAWVASTATATQAKMIEWRMGSPGARNWGFTESEDVVIHVYYRMIIFVKADF
jgi:hypothetical protein